MKRLFFIILVVLTVAIPAFSAPVGKVQRVSVSRGEIHVSVKRAGTVRMGQKLYIMQRGTPVILRAVFPMMTSVKCRMLPGYRRFLPSIKRNSVVHSYTRGVSKKTYKEIKKKSGSIYELSMLCNKSKNHPAVAAYLEKLGKPDKVSTFKDSYYYSYKRKGISIRFLKNDTLQTIFLYAEGADGFKQYPHILPEGLMWTDLRKHVERKLGTASKSGGNGVIPYWVSYPAFGIHVTYKEKSTTLLNNPIHHIGVKEPEKPE